MWYCGMAHSASSFVRSSFCSKHAHGCPVSRSSIHGEVVRIGDAVERAGARRREQHELDAVDHLAHRADGLDDRPGHVDQRLAVHGVGGVEVHELADPVGGPVGDRR